MTRNNMETNRFISYNAQDILVTEGTHGRHLDAGTEAEAMKDCVYWFAHVSLLLMQLRPHALGQHHP